jgi:hypothetical protein
LSVLTAALATSTYFKAIAVGSSIDTLTITAADAGDIGLTRLSKGNAAEIELSFINCLRDTIEISFSHSLLLCYVQTARGDHLHRTARAANKKPEALKLNCLKNNL